MANPLMKNAHRRFSEIFDYQMASQCNKFDCSAFTGSSRFTAKAETMSAQLKSAVLEVEGPVGQSAQNRHIEFGFLLIPIIRG